MNYVITFLILLVILSHYVNVFIYFQIVAIVINSALFIMSLYDTLFSRRSGGDPTNPLGETEGGTTINNPGFKDSRGKRKVCVSVFM